MTHDDERNVVSRRKTLQLTLAVTAFGLALGKQAIDNGALAKQVMVDGKAINLSRDEYSYYIKLSKSEQSYYIKLSNAERGFVIKLNNIEEQSRYLKLKATD